MSFRLLSARVLRPALMTASVAMAAWALDVSGASLQIVSAQAQPKLPELPKLPDKLPEPLERARTAVESLIDRLRGRDMPEGIVKTNGRLEATQVDVSAKYPGRLATLTVNEGDEVTAGQVVATISSPETEAQLRAAQAQVLKAKRALAEATALIAQRKSDLDIRQERTMSVESSCLQTRQYPAAGRWISAATNSKQAEAAYVAANAQREQAEAAIKAPRLTSSGSSRFSSIWCSCPREADACNTGWLAPVRWSPQGSAF